MLMVTMLYCGSMLTSCDDDDESVTMPQLNVNFVTSDATTAQIEVVAQNLAGCAYLAKEGKEHLAPSNDVVFARGTEFKVSGANKDTISIPDLKPNTSYVLYVAAKDANENLLEKVESVAFSTTDFTDPVTIVERKFDGFTVHVKAPKEVQDSKHALRFTRGVLPFYNMLKMQGVSDAEMLLSNGGDERSTTDAITYTFDEAHSLIVDPDTGEEYEIDSPIVPGEPSVFLAGEFSYGESPYGWGEGYYTPCFDTDKWLEDVYGGGGMILGLEEDDNYKKENSYWNGFHHRELVYSKQPALLDAGVKIDTLKLSANNVSLLFTPDKKVDSYCVMVCDDALYHDMILPMFNNDEKYLQWFTTSYMAFSQLGAMSFSGAVEFNLDEFFEEGFIEPDLKFHVLITALGDEHGESQSFQHLEIITPQRTMPAPVLAVEGIENPNGVENPYEVWFNVKTVGDIKLAKGKYVANYERETEAMFGNGYDAATLVENSGNAFTDEDIDFINSPEGLNVRFDSRANTNTYFIAVGYNEEGLNSEAVIGQNRSAKLPAADKIDSPYFKGLEGEWTAAVTMSRKNYETGEWEKDATPTQFKVNIGNQFTYPENLPSDVYDLYENMSKDKVDALYSEFKDLSKDYTQRLVEQNCLLCTGFNVEGVADGKMESRNPYELFISKDYSGYNNEALFFDFGPKWFLHVTADGKISVPINTDYMAPLSNWKTDGPYRETFYLVGLGENAYVGTPSSSKDEWPSFPVEVSEDMNQITVNPIVIDEQMYYPSPVTMRYGQAMPAAGCKAVSAITLTKGWNEPASVAKVTRNANQIACEPVVSANGKNITPMKRPMARTSFLNTKKDVKRAKLTHRVTSEEFKAGMTKLAMQWLKGQQIKK